MMNRRSLLIFILVAFLIPLPRTALADSTEDEIRTRAKERREVRLSRSRIPKPYIRTKIPTTTKPFIRSRPSLRDIRARVRARAQARAKRTGEAPEKKKVETTKSRELILIELVRLTNEERARRKFPPYQRNPLLDKAASSHAEDMMKRKFFAHVNPDGASPADRIKATGYLDISFDSCNCRAWRYTIGENIAQGQTVSRKAMEGWMSSESHRQAILSPVYTEIGVAKIATTWVQTFGHIQLTPK